MSDKERSNPSFSAPLWAAARQGSKEFAQYLPAFPDNPRCVEEPGTLGNPTQAMVTEQIGSTDSYHQMLDSYTARYAERSEPQRDQEMQR